MGIRRLPPEGSILRGWGCRAGWVPADPEGFLGWLQRMQESGAVGQHVTQQGSRPTGPRAESGCGREGEVEFRAEVNLFPTSDGSFESAGIQCVRNRPPGPQASIFAKDGSGSRHPWDPFQCQRLSGTPMFVGLWVCGLVGLWASGPQLSSRVNFLL